MKEVKTKVNSTLTLECECQGVPPPTISWYKDGRVSLGPREPPASAWSLLEKAGRASGPAPLYILIRNPTFYRELINIKLQIHSFNLPSFSATRVWCLKPSERYPRFVLYFLNFIKLYVLSTKHFLLLHSFFLLLMFVYF